MFSILTMSNTKTLREYLSDHNLPIAVFARRLKVSRVFMSNVVHGKHIPSPYVMQKISEITGGQIGVLAHYVAREKFNKKS